MIFILGITIGMLIAVIAMLTEIFFRTKKAGMGNLIEDMDKRIGHKKASIIMPKTDEEEAEEEIININKKAGRDTNLSEL